MGPIFYSVTLFSQRDLFFQSPLILHSVAHFSKCDTLFQMCSIFQSGIHFYKSDWFFSMTNFSKCDPFRHLVTVWHIFHSMSPFFFKCDAFFTVWPIFPNVTNFSECDPLFYRVAQSSKCVPYFIVWTIFHIVYHFSKCDPILPVWPNFCRVSTIMERIDNENAAGLRRKCKRSDQPKIERLGNNARLILRKRLKVISLK